MNCSKKKTFSKGLKRLIATLALESINIPARRIDEKLHKLLMLTGKYAKAEHCYILALTEDRSELVCTHRWTRKGYLPALKSIKAAEVPIQWDARRHEIISVPDIFSLNLSPLPGLKEKINPASKSAVIAPLISDNLLWGILGCSISKKLAKVPDELKSVFTIAAELVVNLYEKRQIHSEIEIIKSIVSRSTSSLAFFDRSGKVQFANTAFRERFASCIPSGANCDFYNIFSSIADSADGKLIKRFNAALSGKESQIEVWIKNRDNLNLYEIALYPNTTEDDNITGVIFNGKDITDRVQLETEILKAIRQERKRIGILLHDDLGHDLLAADIRLKLLSDRICSVSPEISDELVEIEKSVKDIMNDVRHLSHGLIPFKNQGLDLQEMLDAATIMMSKYHGLKYTYTIHPEVDITSESVINELFNIVIESSINAIKHSGCDTITIMLSPEKNLYVMKITDNGKGIQENKLRSPGIGLAIMRYRARSIGGHLEITGSRNRGTTVKVSFNPERINLEKEL